MKKLNVVLVALVLSISAAFAAPPVVQDEGMFSSSGTAPIQAVVPQGNGYAYNCTLSFTAVSNCTATFYRPHKSTKVATAANGAVLLSLATPGGSNTVDGYSPTIGTDMVIVKDSGTNGYLLRTLTTVSSYDATNTIYDVSAALNCAAGSLAYLVDVPNNRIFPVVAATDQTDLGPKFVGLPNMPVLVNIPGLGGVSTISGTYEIRSP